MPDFLYSRSGSCTLIAYKEEFFCLLTKHQQRGFTLDSIRVIKGFYGGSSLAFDSFFSVDHSGGEEFEDVCALRIAWSIHRSKSELSDFFLLDPTEPPIENCRLLIAIGIPTHLSSIEYEPAHIQAKTVTIPCRYRRKMLGPARTHQLEVIFSDQHLNRAFLLDGMSGGGVFSIDGGLGAYKTHFRGIIVRGGHGMLYMVDATFVREMLDKVR